MNYAHTATPSTSLPGSVFSFLDSWRVAAAAVVLLLHLQTHGFLPTWVPLLHRVAHMGVIVFFVISGYSIAFGADRHRGQPRAFLIARWSRLYSVVVPALVLALILDHIGGVGQSLLYPSWQYPKWWLHFAFNLVFLGEIWQNNLRPFSIIPYWSLAYEFWFYALMASVMMSPGHLRRFVVAGVLLVMGPKVLLLLPCWLAGVWAYHQSIHVRKTLINAGWIATGLFVSVMFLWMGLGADALLVDGSLLLDQRLQAATDKALKLHYSRWFLADYVIAALFSGAIIVASRVQAAPSASPSVWAALVRWLAPHTFVIYLFHYTLITFAAANIAVDQRKGLVAVLVAVLVIAFCLGAAVVLADTRQFWARFFEAVLGKIETRRSNKN
jgi:peptidoglycan/LPS O-acetylase OafA/YrhL